MVSMTADEKTLEGESFARGMRLTSSNFFIQKIGGEFRFLSKGKGHGLGFSSMEEMRWQRKEILGRKYWKHIFPEWNLLFMKNKR